MVCNQTTITLPFKKQSEFYYAKRAQGIGSNEVFKEIVLVPFSNKSHVQNNENMFMS